jgi:hypothetical protein
MDRAAAKQSGQLRIRRIRIAIFVLVCSLLLLVLLVEFARAGGPQYVAGVSYFDSGLAGQQLTWPGGSVHYYTDQGDLSSVLRGQDADAFVANAFSRWTLISTAAVSATHAGQLAENVSGANVILNSDRTVTMPADVLPGSLAPVAIVYDEDGAVTDALLGAGSSSECFGNAVIGGPDAFSSDAHIAHALVILDGLCAQTSADLPELLYRLVRVFGKVFGLGWSQLNLNVITGVPYPTPEDKAGFPLMHALDSISCVPISRCYPSADQPKMDDHAALSRLYPVTPANLAQFPGKQVLAANTVRIRGSVRFSDQSGNPTQPMQGVNVVARWIDPITQQPSGRYAASSVSGFLFCGNAGNPITGYTDIFGEPYNRFGSNDTEVEGFFDLAGLELPSGTGGQYRLSVESLDPNWSQLVGPYAPWQVQPSGTSQPVIINVNKGDDIRHDIFMSGSATETDGAEENEYSYEAPLPLPQSGDWIGTLGSYGRIGYFLLNGQANRTLAIELTTFDENGQTSEQKAQPVIGMWSLAAPEGTPPPAFTSSSFNVGTAGLTRLNAQLLSPTQFRIGIADIRGDGRPDFRYRAHILYGDTVTPSRIPVLAGAPITLRGMGFRQGMAVTVGSQNATLLAVSANQLTATAPSLSDGEQSVTIIDPATGSSTSLQNAVTYGAGPNDLIRLTQGGNSPTPVGGEAPNAVRVLVTTPDGITPVNGATVQWSASNSATLTSCNGAAACSVLTDESGRAETRVRAGAVGTAYITATLAPASYSPAKLVQAAVSGNSSAKDLSILSPKVWVAQGATVDVPLTARLLANGTALVGQTLNFQVGIGSGTPSPPSAVTDSNGYARSSLRVSTLSGDVQGTVCVAPGNNPCQTFYVLMVSSSALRLENVAGSIQAVPAGQSFQPIWVRVTDSAVSANPVAGASVAFRTTVFAPYAIVPVETNGESTSSQHPQKIVLSSSQANAITDANGLASLAPATGGLNRALEVEITATAGSSAKLEFQLHALPQLTPPAPGASNGTPRRSAVTVQSHQQPQASNAHNVCEYGECNALPPEHAPSPPVPQTKGYSFQTSSFVMKMLDDKCDECGESEVPVEKCGSADAARKAAHPSEEEQKDCPNKPKSCSCK